MDSQAYKDTQDIYGFSVLEFRNNPRKQEKMLGKEFFREGRWTGKSYADIEFERLKALANEEHVDLPTRDDLKRLDDLERKRLRSALGSEEQQAQAYHKAEIYMSDAVVSD